MNEILQNFLSLYKGKNPLRNHFLYMLLLLFPASAGAVSAFIDPDVSKKVFMVAIIVTAVLLVLSIIPAFFLSGIYYQYLHNKQNGEIGLPQITGETFMVGVKAFPLALCWFIYAMVIVFVGGAVALAPFILMIAGSIYTNSLLFLIFLPLIIIFCIVVIFFISLLIVFITYVNIAYAKDYRLEKRLFNPLIMFKYMTRSFKPTFFVFLKFLLASIILSIIAGTVTLIIALFIGLVCLTAGVSLHNFISGIMFLYAAVLFISLISGIISSYSSGVLGFAMASSLLKIYDEKICVCEEQEFEEIELADEACDVSEEEASSQQVENSDQDS